MRVERKTNTKARLEWLLDFLNEDVETLPTGEVLKLFYEFETFMDPDYEIVPKDLANIPRARENLKEYQDHLTERMHRILKSKEGTLWGISVSKIQYRRKGDVFEEKLTLDEIKEYIDEAAQKLIDFV